jgi:hypothetical protein
MCPILGVRRGAGGTFHELRSMPEEKPDGWDACADWDLRIRSKMWWKEQRDRDKFDSLETPIERLFHACRIGAVPWVEELISSGEVKATDTYGQRQYKTPLHMAALRGNCLTGLLLLKHGADVNAEDNQQSTPLHCAAAYGRLDMCRMLLDNGARADAQDMNEETPLDLAVDYKREEVALFFLELGCPCVKHAREKVLVHEALRY